MEEIQTNMQKYYNYKEQMDRLKKALREGFYLESIFIEYAVIEDRLESVLRHAGKWNPDAKRFPTITKKISTVAALAETAPAKRYFSPELLEKITVWKDRRNPLIHALLKQSLQSQELESIAQEGNLIVKELCSKTTSYKRALEREAAKKTSGK